MTSEGKEALRELRNLLFTSLAGSLGVIIIMGGAWAGAMYDRVNKIEAKTSTLETSFAFIREDLMEIKKLLKRQVPGGEYSEQ